MMLGWNIGVYRQKDKGTAPCTINSQTGTRLAVWQTGVGGLEWIDKLVKEGKAIDLHGGGYPHCYTATAEHLIPHIVNGPPEARSTWGYGPTDVITDKWAGKTVIDHAAVADCRADEWLLVHAWDES